MNRSARPEVRRDPAGPRPALGAGTFGPLLIGIGVLFLVDRVAFAIGLRGGLWALLFGLGAALFFWLYSRDNRNWWALIPAFGLVAMAAAVMAGAWGGALLFGIAGVICIALYLRGGRSRWYLLVGGALATLALMGLAEGVFPAIDNGWVLFGGLAATLFFLHARGGSRWTLYLAIALAALGLISLFTGRLVETLIAIALIASGAAVVWQARDEPRAATRNAMPRPEERPMPPPAPPERTVEPPLADEAQPVNRPRWARLGRGRRSNG